MGRPSKYKASFCAELIKYFDIEPYVKTKDGLQANDLPMFARFARKIGVTRGTLNDWCEQHKDFAVAYEMAKDCQEYILVTNGLRGLYPPSSWIFTAKNVSGYRDSKDADDGKKPDDAPPLPKNTASDVDRVLRIASERRK